MIELLAAFLVAVWLVGIGLTALSVVQYRKVGEGELHERFEEALDERLGVILTILAVLIVFWPATLVYSIATRRK